MMMAGSSKTIDTEGTPDKFPAGLRVLVVDDDPISLKILEKMLKQCNYQVTTCNKGLIGLALLRENKNGYDIVMVDVHKPHMDGFRLLGHIGLEMDIPVIKAEPSKILELMNDVPGMSIENAASHLQKYRLYLKRMEQFVRSNK